MKKRDGRGQDFTRKLYVLPFLLVCAYFIWTGMEELLPGPFGMVWTALAVLVALYAAFHLFRKEERPSGGRRTADKPEEAETGGQGAPEMPDIPEESVLSPDLDSLMEDVDRILGPEGMEEAKLAQLVESAEQRAKLGELAALYELRSISSDEYQRRRREMIEDA